METLEENEKAIKEEMETKANEDGFEDDSEDLDSDEDFE